jgi:uncharacterized membrane protein YhaH (DUF805 family)
MATARDVLGKDGRIGPFVFFGYGVFLFAIKFALDRTVATIGFGRDWSLHNYLIPLESYNLWSQSPADRIFYATMLLVAVPFVWIGLVLTTRRLRDADLPRWLAFLFFVPAANLIFFAALSVIETHAAPEPATVLPVEPDTISSQAPTLQYGRDALRPSQSILPHILPRKALPSAFVAVMLPIPFTMLMAYLAVSVFKNYGAGIFIAMPFVLGLVSSVLHGYGAPRTVKQCLCVGILSLLASGAAMISFAIEGLGCLIMLAPLAIPVAMLGAVLGHAIQQRPDGRGNINKTLWTVLIIWPLLTGAESLHRDPPRIFSVTTSVEVNASPQRVWENVIAFGEIPSPPSEWIFRAGVAYPLRASIDGVGPGAIRRCEFSTGAFIEPIEVWDPPHLLRFSVTSNPPPMREWSPYHIHPPHLEGFLVSHQGQFRLIELPGGRTRLEGTTWYEHGLMPETYWRWWSDDIIHRIHRRVLTHVKQLSESPESATSVALSVQSAAR